MTKVGGFALSRLYFWQLRSLFTEFPMSDVPQSDSRTADGRFAQGNPGGPGRPRKVIKAAADALDQRAAQAAGDVFELTLSLAKERNLAAVKMLLDRVWPVGRNRLLEIALPEIRATKDLLPAGAAVTNTVFAGEATAREGADLARVLKAHMDAIDLIDIERRITELEQKEIEEERKARQRGDTK
jgi:hypothetical protein